MVRHTEVVTAAYEPTALHSVHITEPVVDVYVPAGHKLGGTVELAQEAPAGHGVQLVAPVQNVVGLHTPETQMAWPRGQATEEGGPPATQPILLHKDNAV